MPAMSLLARIHEAADRHPANIALSCATLGELTYSEFARLSRSLNSRLRQAGLKPDQRVMLFMKRSGAVILSMHAVLDARCVYIPVYRGTPVERLKALINDSAPHVILCDSDTVSEAHAVANDLAYSGVVFEFNIEMLRNENAQYHNDTDLEWPSCTSDFSIIYTSGSTGVPKGVMLTHGNMQHYIDWAVDYFDITNDDVVFSTAPFHFDMSSFDIFVSLATGAKLVVATEKDCLFPKLLVKKLQNERATIWKGVSALLASTSKSVDLGRLDLSSLTRVIFAGERLPVRYLQSWIEAQPHIAYFNGYGPTEATGVSCCYQVPRGVGIPDSVPIGKGRTDGEIHIFEGNERVTESGRQGQIVISGPGVSKGYWGDQGKTARSFAKRIGDFFFDNPAYMTGDLGYFDEDGNIVFCGRNDRQIKHQGYRIELDDIEAALHRAPNVKDAAVLYDADGEVPSLVAFFESDEDVSETDVRAEISAHLPAYMTPRIIRRLDRIPRNERGKVDYLRLREIYL